MARHILPRTGSLLTLALVAIALLLPTHTASAHQPHYVATSTAITDTQPTISKAYYGTLAGEPASYTVTATSSIELYVNILAPDIPGTKKNFVVTITDKSSPSPLATLNDPTTSWQRWYEPFGGDWYWQGPEFKQQVPAGTYRITVHNPGNSGRYVLAIGETESFPPSTALHTLSELYTIKTQFFNEPWYGIFRGVIGKFLLGAITLLVLLLSLAAWLTARRRRNRSRSRQ